MNIEQARYNMIEQQIRPWDVLDASVLSLLSIVRREQFVPLGCQALSFVDTEVPLREASGGDECMLSPKVEARLLQELALHKHESVLEIGTGSGHMASLLGHKAQQVHSLEINPALVAFARANLRRGHVVNVTVHELNGAQGFAEEAPFDAILLSGSVADVPAAMLAQLKVGGRLAAVVGQLPIMRAVLIRRTTEHDFHTEVLFDTVAPRLSGFTEPSQFKF
ncbi:MAG: protein-L-isoaspartate O-methyltransferase [Pseudorhodobacter sp.]|nr:protein-L-isoaspartate O-methyltransferase [Rhizobacter sp.]